MLHDEYYEGIKKFIISNPGGVIVIYGPTGSGKTSLSIEIGKKYNYEIISVDSRQIYRGLNIGTGKIRPSEMRGIPHHMLDIKDIADSYSVAEYREGVSNIIESIWKGGGVPILCGGTGLYLDSIIFSRSYPEILSDYSSRRKELEEMRRTRGNKALWDLLYTLDPEYAESLHPNNHHYIVRGIEVFETMGISKSLICDSKDLRFPTLFITPYTDSERSILYERIDARVREMFQMGLVEEVKLLLQGASASAPGLQTIGYKEVIDYIEGALSLEECISLVAQHSRNYAKRQITWNKKYEKYNPIFILPN